MSFTDLKGNTWSSIERLEQAMAAGYDPAPPPPTGPPTPDNQTPLPTAPVTRVGETGADEDEFDRLVTAILAAYERGGTLEAARAALRALGVSEDGINQLIATTRLGRAEMAAPTQAFAPASNRGPIPGPLPQPVGGLPSEVGRNLDPFLETEGAPEDMFGGFLAGRFGGLSSLARGAALNQFGPAWASFLTQLEPESFTDIGGTQARFRNFLTGNQPFLNPAAQHRAFVDLAPKVRSALPGVGMGKFFSSNPNVFEMAKGAGLPFINPIFRASAGQAADELFNQFQFMQPDKSFLDFLAQRGGRLFQ